MDENILFDRIGIPIQCEETGYFYKMMVKPLDIHLKENRV